MRIKKIIFVLSFALFFISACGQKKAQTTDVQPQTADDGDYYSCNFLEVLKVKNIESVDSMVIRTIVAEEESPGVIKKDGTSKEIDVQYVLFNRGDTLMYQKPLNHSGYTLYVSKDGRHLLYTEYVNSKGERSIIREEKLDNNLWLTRTDYGSGSPDSTIVEYTKNGVSRTTYVVDDYNPANPPKVVFKSQMYRDNGGYNSVEIISTEDTYFSDSCQYYKNGLKGKSIQTTIKESSRYPNQKVELEYTYKLNDRGDWERMTVHRGDEVGGGVLREIYYKK